MSVILQGAARFKARVCMFVAVIVACVAYSYSPAEESPSVRQSEPAGMRLELCAEATHGLVIGPLRVEIRNVLGEVVQELEIDLAANGPALYYNSSE
jgi:hypothetical protein